MTTKPGPKAGAAPTKAQVLRTLKRKHDQSQRLEDERAAAVHERNALMVKLLAEHEDLTLTDLSRTLGVTYGAVKKAVAAAEAAGS